MSHKLTHISKSYFVKCINIYWTDWELPVGWGKAWRRKDLRWHDLPLSRLHPWHRGAVPGGTPQSWQGGRPGRNPPSLPLKPWSQTGVKYGNHGLPVPVLATVRGSRYHRHVTNMKQKIVAFVFFQRTYLAWFQASWIWAAWKCESCQALPGGWQPFTGGGGSPRYRKVVLQQFVFPQLRDLWDLLHVYVAPSKASEVAGEGLYVRRKVPRWVLLLGWWLSLGFWSMS